MLLGQVLLHLGSADIYKGIPSHPRGQRRREISSLMQDDLSKGTAKLAIGKDTVDISSDMVSIKKVSKKVSGRYPPVPVLESPHA